MKFINKFIILLFMGFTIAACSDFLDVPELSMATK